MKKIIIANWKMNNSFDEAEDWLKKFTQNISSLKKLPTIVLAPPAILLDYIDELLMTQELEKLEKAQDNLEDMSEDELEKLMAQFRKIKLSGQDCHSEIKGAYTGSISAKMLKSAGCEYVILGHSERRQHNFETDEIVAKKVTAALKENLIPIVCVGESKKLRDDNQYKDFIQKQINNSIPKNLEIKELIIAYEPIWSIGTGSIPSEEQIAQMSEFIKGLIKKDDQIKIGKYRVLYGGSTNKNNSAQILSINHVDGLLVGGASLDADEFAAMVSATS